LNDSERSLDEIKLCKDCIEKEEKNETLHLEMLRLGKDVGDLRNELNESTQNIHLLQQVLKSSDLSKILLCCFFFK